MIDHLFSVTLGLSLLAGTVGIGSELVSPARPTPRQQVASVMIQLPTVEVTGTRQPAITAVARSGSSRSVQ
jgi:hypothetical protein